MTDPTVQITRLLSDAAQGSEAAAEELLPLVYEQLRKAAQAQFANEGAGQTLQPTALVHEAYLRLAGPRETPWANRGHFYAAAAQAMRRILVDSARSRGARKAREGAIRELPDVRSLAEQDPETILAVDAALSRLEAEDPEAAAVVRLRFFAGLSVDQTAMSLGISPRSCARLWSYAKAVLYRSLSEQAEGQP